MNTSWGQLTMDEYVKRFIELLRYVPYIKDEKVKIQHFLSGLPQSFQDIIELMNPRHLMTPFEKISISMSNQSIGMSLTRTGKGRIRLDLKRKDLNHLGIRIWERVPSPVIQLKACINKIIPLKVGIGQQNPQRKR
jgi:hypothetical protein